MTRIAANLDATLARLRGAPLDALDPSMIVQSFGVSYAHLRTEQGGDLFLTRFGWPYVDHLLPRQWYRDQYYARTGEKLPGSTGNVYRVSTTPTPASGDGVGKGANSAARSIDIVVKFSRVGQEVPLEIATSFPEDVSPMDIANARFNSPFEEFGLVMDMRAGTFGPGDLRLLAQRPLAIYAPPDEFDLWRLGRSRGRFRFHERLLEQDQKNAQRPWAMELDIKRDYVLIYSWVKGHNAEEMLERGLISQRDFDELTPRVLGEMRAKGFRVLDNKPKHFILTPTRDHGPVLRRDGKLVYALVDFELLERTDDYRQRFKMAQRARYFLAHSRRQAEAPPLPPHLKRQNILGVDYIYGAAPNGGKTWAVGSDPGLVDFFLPDRWRRTPRVRLSPTNEVYCTRTRDGIHVVYRRSRIGQRPNVDPFYEHGKRIRAHGFNSPFEEVAVAETLRRIGVATAYPRAIYRTGHESMRATYMTDHSRYETLAELKTPDDQPESILSPRHDYYVIWGYWRGIDPMKDYRVHGHWGMVDTEQAYQDELLSEAVYRQVVDDTQERLARCGFGEDMMDTFQYLLSFDPEGGRLRTDEQGRIAVTLCIDALRAFDHRLMTETEYRQVIERTSRSLRRVGCDALSLSGDHLLLSMDPDGHLQRNTLGHFQVTLCNFELIRMRLCYLGRT